MRLHALQMGDYFLRVRGRVKKSKNPKKFGYDNPPTHLLNPKEIRKISKVIDHEHMF